MNQVFGGEATLFIHNQLEQYTTLYGKVAFQNNDAFAKGLEDWLSSGTFAVLSRILCDILPIYDSFSKIGFEIESKRFEF